MIYQEAGSLHLTTNIFMYIKSNVITASLIHYVWTHLASRVPVLMI